jgi:chromosome segregation ATPase
VEDRRANPSLREYFERYLSSEFDRIRTEIQRVWDRFASMQVAVDKFETENHEWRQNANEFRGALKDQATRLASATELVAVEKSLEARIEVMSKSAQTALEAAAASKATEHTALSERVGKLETANSNAETRRSDQKDAFGKRLVLTGLTLGVLQFIWTLIVYLLLHGSK